MTSKVGGSAPGSLVRVEGFPLDTRNGTVELQIMISCGLAASVVLTSWQCEGEITIIMKRTLCAYGAFFLWVDRSSILTCAKWVVESKLDT